MASSSSSKALRITTYVLLGLVSLLFLFAGGSKALATEGMVTGMEKIHWSVGAMRALGVFEVILVALLWWRPARTLALSALLLIMAGAAGSHIAVGDAPAQYVPQFAFAALIGGALVADRGEALWDFLLRRGRYAAAASTESEPAPAARAAAATEARSA